MTSQRGPRYHLVEDVDSLGDCVDALWENRCFYLDTEFESNRKGTRLCLIQLRAKDDIYLIDPLAIDDLRDLSELLSGPSIEWVLHAGLQDVRLLTQELKIDLPGRLFDTQIAYGLLSAESSVSLAYLQFKMLGVRSNKAHQADDWVRRPLPKSQLAYAASDVEYLPKITEELKTRAKERNRLDTLYAASLDTLNPAVEPPAPLRMASFRNAWQLAPERQAALEAIIHWYNDLPSRERLHAPENKALLSLASRMPENLAAMSRIKGIGQRFLNDYGSTLLQAMKKNLAAAQEGDYQLLDPPAYATFEEIALDGWLGKMKADLALELGISPELALPGRVTKRMKAAALTQGEIGILESLVGWREMLLLEPLREYLTNQPLPEDATRS
ncbi:MAG: HRDC domain-containing protein [Polyangiaceae bacterium]|nr:HRDC domain-containing protein [Polyangiaceae bacterium]